MLYYFLTIQQQQFNEMCRQFGVAIEIQKVLGGMSMEGLKVATSRHIGSILKIYCRWNSI